MMNSEQKKVTLVFYADFGTNKGKGMEVYEMAKLLQKHNLLSKVIIRDFNKKYLKKFPFKKALFLGNKIPRILSLIGKYFLGNYFFRYINDIIFDNLAAKNIPNDSSMVLAPLGMVSVFRKAKKNNIKTILYSTGAHPDILKKKIKNKSHLKMLKKFNESILLSDYIIAHSNFVKNLYIKKGFSKEKVFILPPGVKIKNNLIKNKITDTKEIIYLYVGYIYLAKGIKYLLKAWKKANIKNGKLVLCGDIDKAIKPFLKKYKKEFKNIITTGYVNPYKYYKKASVFVFPSFSEGSARVNLEAMAMGLPVITTEEAGSPVKNNENGFIVPAKNSEILKEKMLYFYNNPKEIQIMGKNSKKIIKNYTLENNNKNFYRIIKIINKTF